MRVNITLALGILVAVLSAQGCSQGGSLGASSTEPDLPKSKPGLWEITTAISSPATTIKAGSFSLHNPASSMSILVKSCVGNQADKTPSGLTGPIQQKLCTRKMTYSGSTLTAVAVCQLGKGWQTTVHSVTTYQGDIGYRTVALSHGVLPPGSPMKTVDSKSIITAKWVSSACPDGMLPGDAMGDDGRILRRTPDGKLIWINTKKH